MEKEFEKRKARIVAKKEGTRMLYFRKRMLWWCKKKEKFIPRGGGNCGKYICESYFPCNQLNGRCRQLVNKGRTETEKKKDEEEKFIWRIHRLYGKIERLIKEKQLVEQNWKVPKELQRYLLKEQKLKVK